jgi:hypothetical protein
MDMISPGIGSQTCVKVDWGQYGRWEGDGLIFRRVRGVVFDELPPQLGPKRSILKRPKVQKEKKQSPEGDALMLRGNPLDAPRKLGLSYSKLEMMTLLRLQKCKVDLCRSRVESERGELQLIEKRQSLKSQEARLYEEQVKMLELQLANPVYASFVEFMVVSTLRMWILGVPFSLLGVVALMLVMTEAELKKESLFLELSYGY